MNLETSIPLNPRDKENGGFTAVEMFIVISVIIMILIGAAKNIAPLQVEWKVYQISSQVSTVHAAASSWTSGGIYTGVSMAVLKDDFLPPDYSDGKGINPYGGDVTAAPNSDPYNLDVSFTKIKSDAGVRAVKKYGASYSTYDKTSKVLTITVKS